MTSAKSIKFSPMLVKFRTDRMPFKPGAVQVQPFSSPPKRKRFSRNSTEQLFNQWTRGQLSIEEKRVFLIPSTEQKDVIGLFVDTADLKAGLEATPFKGPAALFYLCVGLDIALINGAVEGWESGIRLPGTALEWFYGSSSKDIRRQLGVKKIHVGWSTMLALNFFLLDIEVGSKEWEMIFGNKNQVNLAEKAGISNLGSLYSALSALGLVEKLKYNEINLSATNVEELIKVLKGEGWKKYVGNKNQVNLAKEAGISNLGSLYTALSALGYVKKLEYNLIDLPAAKVEKLIKVLEQDGLKKYVGNKNQVKLAKEAGISNLGHLYTALSALRLVKKLKYNKINLPVIKVEKLIEVLDRDGLEKYIGNKNQVNLADAAGISHLGQLYSALSALRLVKKLEYNVVDLPTVKVESLIKVLDQDGFKKYIGNENQIKLAKKAGISHLGQLYSALSVLGYAEGLKYNLINLPAAKAEELIKVLEQDWPEKYVGNKNQVKLAKEAGISNLGSLYTALSALGYVKKLKYNSINLPIKKVRDFYEDLILFVSRSSIALHVIAKELRRTKPVKTQEKFREIENRYHFIEEEIKKHRRGDWPRTFYSYLLRLAIYADSPATVVRNIILFIEREDEKIRRFKEETLGLSEQEVLNRAQKEFGEYALPVMKFLWYRFVPRREGITLREMIVSERFLAILSKQRTLTPLEILIRKYERELLGAVKDAIKLLNDEEKKIFELLYEKDLLEKAAALQMGIAPKRFKNKHAALLQKIKDLIGYKDE